MLTTRHGWIASLILLWTVGVGCGASPVPDAASSSASTVAQDAVEVDPARWQRVRRALAQAQRVSPPDAVDVRIVLDPRQTITAGEAVFSDEMQARLVSMDFDPQTEALDMWTQPHRWSNGALDVDAPFAMVSWRNDVDRGSIAVFGRAPGWSGSLTDVATWWWTWTTEGAAYLDPVLDRPVFATEFGVWVDLGEDYALVMCAEPMDPSCHLEVARRAIGDRPVAARDAGWARFEASIDPSASQLYLATDPDAFSTRAVEVHALWAVEHAWDEGDRWRTHRQLAYDPATRNDLVRTFAAGGGVRATLAEDRPLVAAVAVAPGAVPAFGQDMLGRFAPDLLVAMDANGVSLDALAPMSSGMLGIIGITRPSLPGLDMAGIVAAMRVDDIAAVDAWLDGLAEAARARGSLVPSFDDGHVRWMAFGPAGLVLTLGRAGDLLVVGRHTLAVSAVLNHHTDAFVADPDGASYDVVADAEGAVDLLVGAPSDLSATMGGAVGTVRMTGTVSAERDRMTVVTTADVVPEGFEALFVEALDGPHADMVGVATQAFTNRVAERRDEALGIERPLSWPPDPDGFVVMELDVAATRRLNARTDLLADQQEALQHYERYGFVLVLTDGTDLAWSIDELDPSGQHAGRGWSFGEASPTSEDGVWIARTRSFTDGTERTVRLVFDRPGGAVIEFPTPIVVQISDAVVSPWTDPLVTRLHGTWEPDIERMVRDNRARGASEPAIDQLVADFEQANLRWHIRSDGVLRMEVGDAPPREYPWRASFVLPDGFTWLTNEGLSNHARFGWDDDSITFALEDGTTIWLHRVDE